MSVFMAPESITTLQAPFRGAGAQPLVPPATVSPPEGLWRSPLVRAPSIPPTDWRRPPQGGFVLSTFSLTAFRSKALYPTIRLSHFSAERVGRHILITVVLHPHPPEAGFVLRDQHADLLRRQSRQAGFGVPVNRLVFCGECRLRS